MSQTEMSDRLSARWARYVAAVEGELTAQLAARRSEPAELGEAMAYAVMGPGKRVRPVLVLASCEMVGGGIAAARAPAAAIECVHAFSLVHDDLPSMDNDDLRRGRPTCHKAFGEAMALLAGDTLLVLAFELIVTGVQPPETAARMVAELAAATGYDGMAGGQADDVLGEGRPPDRQRVERIHRRKTARLIEAACRLGGLAGGAEGEDYEALGAFGRELGLAFQIADDLLDATGSAAVVGKQVGKDAASGKQTYPAVVGIEASRQLADEHIGQAVASLSRFGDRAEFLRDLACYVVARQS